MMTTTARLPPLLIQLLSALAMITQDQIGVLEKPHLYRPKIVEMTVKIIAYLFSLCCSLQYFSLLF